jgi:hypothetical protein
MCSCTYEYTNPMILQQTTLNCTAWHQPQACKALGEAVAEAAKSGLNLIQARCLGKLGQMQERLQRPVEAEAAYEQALQLWYGLCTCMCGVTTAYVCLCAW